MDRVFQIAAVTLAGLAGYFFWIGNRDYAFVSVVLGCVAFFLSVRFQVKERNRIRAAEYARTTSEESELSSEEANGALSDKRETVK